MREYERDGLGCIPYIAGGELFERDTQDITVEFGSNEWWNLAIMLSEFWNVSY